METPFKNIVLNNISHDQENIRIGKVRFKFYHDQKCPSCGYCSPGWNDKNSEGPWDFECSVCSHKWSIVMDFKAKNERRRLLSMMVEIDALIESAKQTNRERVDTP